MDIRSIPVIERRARLLKRLAREASLARAEQAADGPFDAAASQRLDHALAAFEAEADNVDLRDEKCTPRPEVRRRSAGWMALSSA